MKRGQKTDLVQRLSERLQTAKVALVAEYRGMTAAESNDLRRRLRAVRGELRVAKNTLVRRAIEKTSFAALDDKLRGPVGLILGFEDAVEVAKTVTSYKDAGDRLKLRGGVLDGQALSAEEVQALAMLPPRDVLIAQLLGLLKAPATRLVRVLNEPGCALARLLDAVGKKNAGEGAV